MTLDPTLTPRLVLHNSFQVLLGFQSNLIWPNQKRASTEKKPKRIPFVQRSIIRIDIKISIWYENYTVKSLVQEHGPI